MNNPGSNDIWSLMAKKLSGEASTEELQQLEDLLREMPQESYAVEIMQDLWKSKPGVDRQYGENQYKALLQRMKKAGIDTEVFHEDDHYISDSIDVHPPKRKWLRLLSYSLLAAVITTGVFFLYNREKKVTARENTVQNEVSTKNGSKTSLVLPDGTRVWLNAGSKLTYNKNYESNAREVWLSGEAYFDVVKNPDKPFIIYTGKMDIKVLGTTFNVKCYPGEKTSETSLVKGSVEITLKDRQEKIVLKPNEKLIVNNTEIKSPAANTGNRIKPEAVIPQEPLITLSHLTREPIDSEIIETSWVNNKLIFNNENFEEIAVKMERWYGIVIEVNSDKLKAKRFSGTFENETIAQALEAMRLTTPFNFSINKDKVIISQK